MASVAEQTRTRWPRRMLLFVEALAWTAFFTFAALFLALRYWVLPNIEDYRPDITAALSRAAGLPVKFGALTTDWQGLRPRIAIADVRVYDREGREALVLPAVENVIAWRSFAARELRLHSILIDAPKLAVRRDADGRITVGGIAMAQEKGEGGLTDWLLSQSEIVVRDAELEWRDEQRGAPPLRLSAVNFRLQNDGRRHALGLRARPPAELGPGLELRALLDGGSIRELANWNGRLYAEFGYTDLAAWRTWVDYPLDVRRGEGALRLWASLQGRNVSQATADVLLSNVVARLGSDLPVLEMNSVQGRLYGRQTPRGYDFGVRGLALAAANAPPMNATSFRASWEPASIGSPPGGAGGAPAQAASTLPQRGSLSANQIELAPLAHLAEYLPLPADLRKLLQELAPQGNLLDARLDWVGTLPDQATYVAKTRFAGLSMNAWRSIPGFSNLTGSLDATEKKGSLLLAGSKVALELPRVFPAPRLAFDSLSGEMAWERGATPALAVRLNNFAFANEDLAGSASGSYAWTGEGPGSVDLSAHMSRFDGRQAARYLPLPSLMGARTREWVAGAVQGGQASDLRLRLKGDLRDFPYAHPDKGTFQVTAKVSKGVLEYVSGWPRIENIEADLLFERQRIVVNGRSGSILGTRLSNVKVALPDLMAEQPVLSIEGGAEGPTADFLNYIQASPVKRMLGGFTDAMAGSGRGRLRLKLDLPLQEPERTRLAGDYQFAGNTVTVDARLPPIERATGRVAFTESGITVHDTRGQLFGGEVRIHGGTRPEGGILVQAEGRATVEGLRPVFDHPWRRRLSGATRYTAQVSVRDGRAQLGFDSSLEGVTSALPAPLAKGPAEALPLRLEIFPGEGRDRVSAQLGPPGGRIVAAEFLRAGSGPAAQPPRALITLNPVAGEPLRIPERRGVTLRGSLPALDLDRWLPLLTEANAAAAGAAAVGNSGEGASFELKVGVLDALGKRMRSVIMLGIAEAGGWSANMTTTEFAGDLSYRNEGSGRLLARFARFTLPEDAPAGPGAPPVAAGVQSLPAVDIIADSFTHRGRRVGRVEVQARHEGRDWRIDKLAVTNPDSALTGSGLWKPGEAAKAGDAPAAAGAALRAPAEPSRTTLNFKLEVSDVGNFLERFGYPDHLKGGKGKLEGVLNWNGDPTSLDYATLGGQLQMQAEDGQFLEIEPGIGKLVSLMSLQMLPRRVALDFRDVFSKGFQFDRIASSMAIERGVMGVKEFHMRGPAADVNMNGRIDLSLETQALDVRVIPQLGDTASTVVGLINPVAGVATLIAGRLLKNPLGKVFAFEYKISGTWSDPKVDKVQAPPSSTPIER